MLPESCLAALAALYTCEVNQTAWSCQAWGFRCQATAQHVAQSRLPTTQPVHQAEAQLDKESRQSERLQDDFEKAMWPERG